MATRKSPSRRKKPVSKKIETMEDGIASAQRVFAEFLKKADPADPKRKL